MADIRLSRIPDRTPVKLSIAITPELHDRLQAYARLYASVYGSDEPVAELIPAIIASFLDSDRAFAKAAK